MQNIRRFLFSLVFPASTAQSLAIFLFLIILVAASQVGLVQNYFFDGGLAKDIAMEASKMAFGGEVGKFEEIAAMVKVFSIMSLIPLAIGGFSWLVILLLLGRVKPDFVPRTQQRDGDSPKPGQSRVSGFSIALYALGALGAGLTNEGASVFLVYFAMLVFFGFIFLNSYADQHDLEDVSGQPDLIRIQDSLFGVLTSGGFFLYYWFFLNQVALTAVVAAYASYTLSMSLYRIALDILYSQKYVGGDFS